MVQAPALIPEASRASRAPISIGPSVATREGAKKEGHGRDAPGDRRDFLQTEPAAFDNVDQERVALAQTRKDGRVGGGVLQRGGVDGQLAGLGPEEAQLDAPA